MNQSITSLIKLKLFQGNSNSTPSKSTNDQQKTDRNVNIQDDVVFMDTDSEMDQNDAGKETEFIRPSDNLISAVESDSSNVDYYEDNDRISIASPKKQISPRKESKMSRLRQKMSILDLKFRSDRLATEFTQTKEAPANFIKPSNAHRHNHINNYNGKGDVLIQNLKENPSQPKKSSHTFKLRTKSASLSPGNFVLEAFPTTDNTGKNNNNQLIDNYSLSRISTNSSTGSSTRFLQPSKRNTMNSQTSLRFGNVSRYSTVESIDDLNAGSSVVSFQKKRSINRQRSRTVDASDLSDSHISNIPYLHKTRGSMKTKISGIQSGRSHSSSLSEKGPLRNSMLPKSLSQSQLEATSIAKTSYEGTRSPRLSGGAIPVLPPSFHLNGANNSAYSVSRRSSSIVNTLSNFVNMRSSSFSSNKQPGIQLMKRSVTLDDFPPVESPKHDEPYDSYLKKLSPFKKFIAVSLCSKDDPYKIDCLSYYLTNYFNFANDPLDIALRKLLVFLELPKEAQQIDRLLTVFGKVYYKQQAQEYGLRNIWKNENQVYFVVFSLLVLHTDYFNANNKHKMTKHEFVDLVHGDIESDGDQIPIEILQYYYDNIVCKESPIYDINSCIDNKASSEETIGSSEIYSPIDIVKSKLLIGKYNNGSNDYTQVQPPPVPSVLGNRSASNSISSYFSHATSSTSGKDNPSLLQDDIDIYQQIFSDNVKQFSLGMQVENQYNGSDYNVELNTKNKYDKYFKVLIELKGGYIRLPISYMPKVQLPPFQILNEDTCSEFYYFKILQMGEIQEYAPKRFSLTGNRWKPRLVILTSCGIFIYDKKKIDFGTPEIIRDTDTGESNFIIDFKSGAEILSGCGLLAELSDVAENEITICGQYGKMVWRCENKNETVNWIDSINFLGCLDGIHIDLNTLKNTIVTLKKYNIKERYKKLTVARQDKIIKFNNYEKIMTLYYQSVPISLRTRNDMVINIKQLAVKMDWTIYEIKRNKTYLIILDFLKDKFHDILNIEKPSKEDNIDDSFIFREQNLQKCDTSMESAITESTPVYDISQILKF